MEGFGREAISVDVGKRLRTLREAGYFHSGTGTAKPIICQCTQHD